MQMSIRVGLLLLLLPGLHAGANAETDIRINAVELVSWGIFEANIVGRYAASSRTRVAGDSVKAIDFVEFTNDIPMELGINFGFQYIVNTSPKGQTMEVTHVIRFPGEGLQEPGGHVYRESTEQVDTRIGYEMLHGYGFDVDWELVPGDWIFEVWHKDARLVRKTFHVVPPSSE